MDNPENSLIIASTRQLPAFEFNTSAKEAKSRALEKSALIARVTDHDSKVLAVRAQEELKRQINAIEKARKTLKEPILDAGRKLDSLCATESLELEKEFGRVSNAVKDFDDGERRRIAEEERLQCLELERIERERQAELKRIADEQAEAERKIQAERERIGKLEREAREAAEKLSLEATNKSEREAAAIAMALAKENEESNRKEEERMRAEVASKAAAESAVIQDRAGDAAYVAGRPIEITKVAGQVTRAAWEITKINEWALAKGRPDLVRKIEFDMVAVKAELNRGVKLPGVEAREVYKPDVRVGKDRNLIEV